MNTYHIKDLAIAAGLNAPHGSDHEGLRDFDYRMYAQLIVDDCVNWINTNVGLITPEAQQDLHAYFGIK